MQKRKLLRYYKRVVHSIDCTAENLTIGDNGHVVIFIGHCIIKRNIIVI